MAVLLSWSLMGLSGYSMEPDVKIYPRFSGVKKAIILYPSSLLYQNLIIRVCKNVCGVNITGATFGKKFWLQKKGLFFFSQRCKISFIHTNIDIVGIRSRKQNYYFTYVSDWLAPEFASFNVLLLQISPKPLSHNYVCT